MLSLVLVGCVQTRWTSQNFNIAQWRIDDAACEREAAIMFPPDNVTRKHQGFTAPVSTNCYDMGYTINCTTTGGESYPIYWTTDLNEGSRRASWERCIRAKGYYTVGEANAQPTVKHPIVKSVEEAKSKTDEVCSRSEYAMLFKKIPCSVDEIELKHLADDRRLNNSEKRIFEKFVGETGKINTDVIKVVSGSSGKKAQDLKFLILDHSNSSVHNELELLKRRRTIGDYNRQRQVLHLKFLEDWRKLLSGK